MVTRSCFPLLLFFICSSHSTIPSPLFGDIVESYSHIDQNSREKVDTFVGSLRTSVVNLPINISDVDVSQDCKDDLMLIQSCIPNQVQPMNRNTEDCQQTVQKAMMYMADASGKPAPGILVGRRVFNGLYSECASVDEIVPGRKRHLQGDYGRLFIDANLRDYTDKDACNEMFPIGVLAFDVCLPKACDTSNDLLTLSRLVKINGSSPVCSVATIDEQPRTTNYQTWITVFVLVLIGIVSAIGTIYDYFFSNKYANTPIGLSKITQCFVAFSIYTNIAGIFSTENANKPGQIGPIHFMRFASLVWVVLGHITATLVYTTTNPVELMATIDSWSTQILTNAYFAVDTFFFMSGLLVAFIWFKEYYRNRRRQMSILAWSMFYVHRLIRLSPPYYLVIAFYTFVFRTFIKNMPNLLGAPEDYCEDNWWINYLYLNNFIRYDKQCYLVSWYLATDLQMYIFAPIILIPMAIKPIVGIATAVGILISSTAANMATIYLFHFPPSDYGAGAMDPRMKDYNQYTLLIYGAPWIRCQVYIIGMLTGYLLQTKKKLHINWVLNLVLWVASLGIGAAVVLCLKDWAAGQLFTPTESAMYSALSKLAWALSLSFITTSCYYGHGGPINEFMSWSVWIPLGRLTYSAYLVHFCVTYYYIGMTNVPFTFTNFSYTFVSITLPVTALTYFFALWWSALIEISTGKVEMIFLGGARGKRRSPTYEKPPTNTMFPAGNASTPMQHLDNWQAMANVNNLDNLSHLNNFHLPPGSPTRPVEDMSAFEKPKKSLYKQLFKRNVYSSFKRDERPEEPQENRLAPPVPLRISSVLPRILLDNRWEAAPTGSQPERIRRNPSETPTIIDAWL